MKKFKAFIILFILPLMMWAQQEELPRKDQFIKGKYGIKLDFGFYGGNKSDYKPSFIERQHNVKLEATYGFTKWLEAGVFTNVFLTKGFKYGNIDDVHISDDGLWEFGDGAEYFSFRYKNFDYGLTANIHILPFFTKPSFSLVDVYVTPKIGLHTVFAKDIDFLPVANSEYYMPINTKGVNYSRTGLYYSLGAGVALNVTKNFGFLVEYNFVREGKSLDLKPYKHYARYGINIRF